VNSDGTWGPQLTPQPNLLQLRNIQEDALLPKCVSPHYPPHKYIVSTQTPKKRKRHRIYKFDSTLGYPGEGLSKIVTYNIAGAKSKIKNVLSDANSNGVDAIFYSRR